MAIQKEDIDRINRIFEKESVLQPVEGSITLSDGILSMDFVGEVAKTNDAETALMSHHLNTNISSERPESIQTVGDGKVTFKIYVNDPLWKFSEIVPPSKITKL